MPLTEELQHGQCARCNNTGLVIIEVGPQAENVCGTCMSMQRERDYAEYRRLLDADIARLSQAYA